MPLKRFYDDALAQASYFIGCQACGEALIIDPMRHVQEYLDYAASEGMKIRHITETHIHADFVSGARELAAASNARLYLSAEGGDDWQYDFNDGTIQKLHEGDSWMVGNVKIEVLHTPGHTPEHLTFLVTDTAAADKPFALFTGDFIFVGDVGRPDLLEEAAGMVGTREQGARDLFASLQRIADLPDYLQIYPGHGAGSACGKALGSVPSSTLGYERLFNPAFRFADESEFVEWLLDGQPEAPKYFGQMKTVNKQGPALLDSLDHPLQGQRDQLDQLLADDALVIDFRNREDFAAEHILGTLSIPATSTTFSTYVGWFVDYSRPTYLLVYDENQLTKILPALRDIGVDDTPLFFTGEVLHDGETTALPYMDAETLKGKMDSRDLTLLDVRGKTERDEKHIEGSMHIPFGHLPKRADELDKDQFIVTHCVSSLRAQIAASWLRANGFEHVAVLGDHKDVWQDVLPTSTVAPA